MGAIKRGGKRYDHFADPFHCLPGGGGPDFCGAGHHRPASAAAVGPAALAAAHRGRGAAGEGAVRQAGEVGKLYAGHHRLRPVRRTGLDPVNKHPKSSGPLPLEAARCFARTQEGPARRENGSLLPCLCIWSTFRQNNRGAASNETAPTNRNLLNSIFMP